MLSEQICRECYFFGCRPSLRLIWPAKYPSSGSSFVFPRSASKSNITFSSYIHVFLIPIDLLEPSLPYLTCLGNLQSLCILALFALEGHTSCQVDYNYIYHSITWIL